ncbi:unnamed protein product [Prorocentrum cordatum]|uniref:Tetratricopeptide repeat protein 38 n=1 Tax=Prorocentrum cordatum TaxID=2364126 RepID=A0ABN9PXC2_9DINO|nr:unnamed protein product [Polarella glacialis]
MAGVGGSLVFSSLDESCGAKFGFKGHQLFCLGLRACGRGGQWQEALSLFSRTWQASVEPDAQSFNVAEVWCCPRWVNHVERNLGSKVASLFGELQEAECESDVDVAPESIEACREHFDGPVVCGWRSRRQKASVAALLSARARKSCSR